MNCINTQSKEYKDLLESSKLPSLLLEMRIAKWQEINGLDKFPTVNDVITSENNIEKFTSVDILIDDSIKNSIFTIKNNLNNKTKEEIELDNYSKSISNLFNNKMGRITTQEVLNNLINADALNDYQKILVKSLLKGTNSKIAFRTLSENIHMQYDTLTNTIIIDKEKFKLFSPEYITQIFLHEVFHDVLFHTINNPKNIDERMFVNLLKQEFNKFTELYDKYNSVAQETPYGFENLDEFVSELMTNPKFKSLLLKLEYKNKSLLSRIAQLIRQLFGLKVDSSLDKLIEDILSLSEQSTYKGGLNMGVRNKKADPTDLYENLETTENKYNKIISRIEQSLNYNINNFTNIANRIRYYNEENANNWDKYITTLKTIRNNIVEFKDVEPLNSLTYFMDAMDSSLSNIQKKLDNIDYNDTVEAVRTHDIYYSYLETYDVVNEVSELLAYIKENKDDNNILTSEEIVNLESRLDYAQIEYLKLSKRFKAVSQKILAKVLENPLFFPEVLANHKTELEKEYKQKGLTINKEKWIADKIYNRDKDIITQKIKESVNKFIKNPGSDIYGSDVSLSSVINISSPLLQIMNTIITNIKNERTAEERVKDLEFDRLFNKIKSEKGTNDVKKLYENILDFSKDGKPYIKSEHSIKLMDEIVNFRLSEFDSKSKLSEINLEIDTYIKNNGRESVNDEKFKSLTLSRKNLENKIKKDNITFLKSNFNLDEKNDVISPLSKWETDLSKLSETEKELLKFFQDETESNNKFYHGKEKLVKYQFKTKFYELPKITKSDTERVWTGETVGILKDKYKDLTETRPDDIGYNTEYTNVAGQKVYKIKAHFRDVFDSFDDKSQSLDIMTIMRLDYQSSNAYRIRKEAEPILRMLVDLAGSKQYYEMSGTRLIKDSSTGKFKLKDGNDSNTFKFAKNMLESKFYDQLHKNNVKFFGADANKAVGFFNSATAFMTMSLNIASGTANVINANAQLFLESFIKGKYIKAKGIKKANLLYSENLLDTIKDVTNPINKSFVNQINELFDADGLFFLSEANFLKSDIIKQGVSWESLQVFQNSGEHYIKSVIVMSVLDGVKVMDENHNLLDENGKIVDNEKDAASILDMLKKDDNGLVNLNNKVVYTTHSNLVKWNEGGKSQIDALVDKKLKDSIGNYKKLDQPDLMRSWYGKLVLLFRKFLVSMGQARLRGIEYAFIPEGKLTPEQRRFSYALQEYEEGTYVTLLRYLYTSIKQKKLNLLLTDWKNLSDSQIVNIKRSVVELIITTAFLPLLAMLTAQAADDDDDNEYLYFLAYQLKRLDTELSAYYSPSENLKMLRSPIPSTRLLEDTLGVLSQLMTPWTLGDVYETGPTKGDNKFITRVKRKIPVVKEFNRQYETLFNFQSRSFGGWGN